MVRRGAVLCAAFSAVAWVSPGVAETSAAVPIELVLGVLGADGEELFIGSLPDELARVVPVPDDATIVGGIERDESSSIVLLMPMDPSGTHTRYGELAGARGWTRLGPAQSSMGFVTPGTNEERFYCGPAASMLGVHVAPSDPTASRITLSYYPGSEFGPCTSETTPKSSTAELAMPILRVPEGVEWGSSTTCSTHADAAGEAVRLLGEVRIAEMVSHFGDQLVGQGWLLEDEAVGEAVGLQSWTRQDESGQPWKGTLSVLSMGADSAGQGVLEASFQIVEGPGR